MNEAPYIAPDIHPNIAKFYRKKVERLAEALHHPSERDEAACAIRGLIERVTLFPGAKPGEMTATLHGELGAIMNGHRSTKPPETTVDPDPFLRRCRYRWLRGIATITMCDHSCTI